MTWALYANEASRSPPYFFSELKSPGRYYNVKQRLFVGLIQSDSEFQDSNYIVGICVSLVIPAL